MSATNETPLTADELRVQNAVNHLKERLALYEEAMKPGKPVEVDVGARMQYMLWTALRVAMRQTDMAFVETFKALLAWVLANRQGCCHERYINRFLDSSVIKPEDRRGFSRIMRLLTATADPRTRKLALRQINMTAATSAFTLDGGDQRIADFYEQ